ncbi:hypothetical protein A7982_13051 [Minicystis rosea]|nr:hypothetical protein A7982_13051 [Minicystis rosea]
MSLEKLTIRYETGKRDKASHAFSGAFEALFNPNQISYSKSVRWERQTPAASADTGSRGEVLRAASSEPETLSISLFFDTYGVDAGGVSAVAGVLRGLTSAIGRGAAAPRATNVMKLTQQVAALTEPNPELGRPPICRLQWGKVLLLEGVLTSLSQQFSLFLEDGTPVRANLECSFQEHEPGSKTTRGETAGARSSGVAASYSVKPGDSLSRIAAATYGDPSCWRKIAEANNIDNPRRMTAGVSLSVPRIR